MSRSGQVIAQTQMKYPRFLSVSTDDVIYLADLKSGVHQSTDDGVTWSHVFKSPDGWGCYQVIKVSTGCHTDVWWIREIGELKTRLRVYTLDRRRADDGLTWRDVTVPSHVNLSGSGLAYDGHQNIFTTDYKNKAVHVWSVSGQYDRQLLSPANFYLTNIPCCLAVDTSRDGHVTLYVGQSGGVVGVWTLTYQ